MRPSATRPLILLVDDSKSILRTAQAFLEPHADIITAEDAFSALALLRDKTPDLLLLDVMMPKMDGYQLCLLIKDIPTLAGVPVLMLSSKDSPFDRAKGDMIGCDGYISKPFNAPTLVKAVQEWLSARPGVN